MELNYFASNDECSLSLSGMELNHFASNDECSLSLSGMELNHFASNDKCSLSLDYFASPRMAEDKFAKHNYTNSEPQQNSNAFTILLSDKSGLPSTIPSDGETLPSPHHNTISSSYYKCSFAISWME
jgi:hypothetical protein